jgi:ubiquinone/menaquinone biosynthesis C-methylase UbiE
MSPGTGWSIIRICRDLIGSRPEVIEAPRMDYDKTDIPSAYDAARGYSAATLAMWLDVISRAVDHTKVAEIVDLGCGTGRFSAGLADCFHAWVIALDPSEKMLVEARRKNHPRVLHIRAAGESLPLRSGRADMVFMSMVFHHLKDPPGTLAECSRVLRPRGMVCLRTGTIDRIRFYGYVPFFKTSPAILNRVLPSSETIVSAFHATGFTPMLHEQVQSETAPDWRTYADRIARRGDSILARLPESEFDEGLRILREYAASAPREPVVEPVDFFCFRSV